MRLGGRLAAAIEVLDDIERRHRPTADALKDWGLSHRFAGAGDRAAIGNIVYDALRRKRSSAWLFDTDTSRALAFGALFLEWGQTPENINRALDGDRFAPPLLNAAELKTLANRRLDAAPPIVRADIPDWCEPHLKRTFGDVWVDEARALAGRPPLDLRVNTLVSDRDLVLAELSPTGAAAAALASDGLRIPPIATDGRHPNVQAEPAFQKGWFEVQDQGSQVVAELAGANPSMRVLDFCAGAGGKTLALAATMENKGQIYAYDAEKVRLSPIFDRIRRAEARNIEVLAKIADVSNLKDQMDLVLIDAPCTGSGTWRRRPDAKWRLTTRQLDVRRAEQAKILDEASAFVKPGGRLAYVTCSVFREENHDQIDGFLEARPDFAPVDHGSLFEQYFPGKSGLVQIEKNRGVLLSPLRTGTDGFFFAALTKS